MKITPDKLVKFLKTKTVLFGTLAVMGAVTSAPGDTFTWVGGGTDTNWSTTGNWKNSTVPTSAASSIVYFTGTSGGTAVLDTGLASPFLLQQLLVSSGAGSYTLNASGGNAVDIYGYNSRSTVSVGSFSSAAQVFNLNFNVKSQLVGFGIGTGGGNVTFNGNIAMGTNTIGILNASSTSLLTINGVISGAGSITFNGDSKGKFLLTGSNTMTNTIIVQNGILELASANALGAAPSIDLWCNSRSTQSFTGNVLTMGAYTFSQAISLVPQTGGSTLTAVTIGGATADASAFTGAITLSSTSAASAASALNVSATTGGIVTFSGGILHGAMATGTGDSVTKIGEGTVIFSGSNTYLGATTISAGTLQIGNSGTTGSLSTSSSIVNNAKLTFKRTNAVTQGIDFSGNAITGTGSLTQAGSGLLTLNTANTFTGSTTLSSGTVSVADTTYLGGASGNNSLVFDGGALRVTGTAMTSLGSHAATFSATKTVTLDIADAANAFTINDALNQTTGGLTKLGVGELILTGQSTYTGTTAVGAGRLTVNGTLAAGSTVSVASGATLGGSGKVSGSVNVANGTVSGKGLNLGATVFDGTSTLSGTTTASSITVASGTTSLTGNATSSNSLAILIGATLENTGIATANSVNVASGGKLVNNGTVNSNIIVSGLMSGTGAVNGNLSLTGGVLSPGNSPGGMTISGNFTMDAASKLTMQVTNGATAGTYDQLVVGGAVTLGGTLDLGSLSTMTVIGQSITLIVNNSGQTAASEGFFSNVTVDGATVTLREDHTFTIGTTEYQLQFASSSASTDNTVNDLTLAVVPEPSIWATLLSGCGVLLILKRARQTRD